MLSSSIKLPSEDRMAIARKVCLFIPPVWELENYVAVNPFMGFIDQPIEQAIPKIEHGLAARVLPSSPKADLRPPRPVDSWLSKWLASFVATEGWEDSSLYEAWRTFSVTERSLELAGVRGWNEWIFQSPATATEVLAAGSDESEAFLYRLLGRHYGWACLMRRQSWGQPEEEPRLLLELLAVLVTLDQAVKTLQGPSREESSLENRTPEHLADLQKAEDRYLSELQSSLLPAPKVAVQRPSVQAVFCIDVRSERQRRGLERFDEVETLGFAGFFGIALAVATADSFSPRCPVLLSPATSIKGIPNTPLPPKYLTSGPSKFAYVELAGLAKAASLVKGAFAKKKPASEEETTRVEFLQDIPLADRVVTAASILKNTGLAGSLAPVVILCGHTSCSENNAHAAGLECGACGGHGGAINARVAAQWLNDPLVRFSLEGSESEIPASTVFVPAIHDTSSDEVRFLESLRLDELGERGVEIRTMFEAASHSARTERAKSLGLSGEPETSLLSTLRKRAADWSEVCPEWGLARNASFIAARRSRTRAVDLGGRAFLHEYDSEKDLDQSVLSMILAAPMVVASWISWQYFASTVDNNRFGAGPKAIQNPIGSLGLVKGHHGDFCTGLSQESVHLRNGQWFHEPLRLQVVVEASPDVIERAMGKSEMVTQLVGNGWVRIYSLDRESSKLTERLRSGDWQDRAV